MKSVSFKKSPITINGKKYDSSKIRGNNVTISDKGVEVDGQLINHTKMDIWQRIVNFLSRFL